MSPHVPTVCQACVLLSDCGSKQAQMFCGVSALPTRLCAASQQSVLAAVGKLKVMRSV